MPIRASPPAGTRQPKPAARQPAIDPDVERVAGAVVARMDLEATRERRVRRLVVRTGEDAPPAERVDHDRRAQLAAVGAHDDVAARLARAAPVDLRRLEPRRRALVPQQPAERRGSRTPTTTTAAGIWTVPCGVVNVMYGSSWRIAPATPIACSHGVGQAHAEVCRSPIS